jgi:arylsulfatase A-like enzyme
VRNGPTSATLEADDKQHAPLHLLLVLVDDLGFNDLGSFNGDGLATSSPVTPFIDGLMEQGIRLKNLHVWPVCSPTRGALLTGRYPIRWGGHSFVGNAASKAWIDPKEQTLADRLKAMGFRTRMVGKVRFSPTLSYSPPALLSYSPTLR